MKKLLFLFILGLGTAAFLFFYAAQVIARKQHIAEPVLIQVNSGTSLKKIADDLHKQNLVENQLYFILYSKFNKVYPKIKAGEYLVDKDVSIKDIADILTSGKIFLRKVTFPEGILSVQAAEILLNNEFLEDDVPDFVDGDILPETYTKVGEKSCKKHGRRSKKRWIRLGTNAMPIYHSRTKRKCLFWHLL